MTLKTIRKCLWCGDSMECNSAGKLICSKSCHGKFDREKKKLGLSKEEMVKYLNKVKEIL